MKRLFRISLSRCVLSTLVFQHPGHGGLQVCPGKERESQQWTRIEPREEVIT